MDILFWSKLALSFIMEGAWVTLGTFTAEKFGSIAGGLLAGFPSTVAIALFFIDFTQSAEVASDATTVIPTTHGVNGFFLLIFILLIRKELLITLSASFFVRFFKLITTILRKNRKLRFIHFYLVSTFFLVEK